MRNSIGTEVCGEEAVEVAGEDVAEVVEVPDKPVVDNKPLGQVKLNGVRFTQGIRLPDMLISPHSSRADVTGVLEKELISVRSQGHAPGRSSGCPNLINEIQDKLIQ